MVCLDHLPGVLAFPLNYLIAPAQGPECRKVQSPECRKVHIELLHAPRTLWFETMRASDMCTCSSHAGHGVPAIGEQERPWLAPVIAAEED